MNDDLDTINNTILTSAFQSDDPDVLNVDYDAATGEVFIEYADYVERYEMAMADRKAIEAHGVIPEGVVRLQPPTG